MTYNEKKLLYESIMKEVAKTVKRQINEIDMNTIDNAIYESLSDDKITISNHKFTTEEIIKICEKYNFKLFIDNFKKNDNSFPYINPDNVKYIVAVSGSDICGIIAYANSKFIQDRRKAYGDNKHIRFAHIFDLETLPKYRGKGIATLLIKKVIEQIKQSGNKGVTLQGINKKTAKMYHDKFGFDVYKEQESPLMELKF